MPSPNMTTEIRLVHFNDVYHIPSVSHLAKFIHLIDSFRSATPGKQSNTLTIFSGDAFSPSLEASVLKGEHMIPILNRLGIDVACYGNHDFDFGDDRLIELSDQLPFPWLLSNLVHSLRGPGETSDQPTRLLGRAREYHIQVIDGVRIGFFGLAGTDKDWLFNLDILPPSEIRDPVRVARKLAQFLRTVKKCDVVIALTHMRLPKDIKVATATASGDQKVDLILGGHDHEVLRRFDGDHESDSEVIQQGANNSDIVHHGEVQDIEGKIQIIKSGTDWKCLSLARMFIERNQDGTAFVSNVKLNQYTDIHEVELIENSSTLTEYLSQMLQSIHDRVGDQVQQSLLHTKVPLEGRNIIVRSQETNLGNMLADAVRAFYDVDIAFFNSGAIRCDAVLGPTLPGGSPLLVRDIINICPFRNLFLVKKLTGSTILEALENSVSDSHADGRFLQLSGVRIIATWKKSEGCRVVTALFHPENGAPEPIQSERLYTVAISAFIASGYDGYTSFPGQETIVGEEAAISDTALMLEIFGHRTDGSNGNNRHTDGIERARQAVTKEHKNVEGLLTVAPVTEDRIAFI